MSRARPRRSHLGPAVAAFVMVLALATGAVVLALQRSGTQPRAAERCTVVLGAAHWSLAPDQSENAALVAAVALRRGLPARAVTIGLATALQESKLRNIDHGDLDSLGLFQQRPSQGWGTPEQVMNPTYATAAFYDRLVKVDGYQQMEVAQAAQAVQRSAFPDAYAQHEPVARAFASALTGHSPATLTCSLRPALGASGAAAQAVVVTDQLVRDLGVTASVSTPDVGRSVVTVGADQLRAAGLAAAGDEGRLGWALAQWAVASSRSLNITAVATADQRWDRAEPRWAVDPHPAGAGEVRITVG